VLGSQRRLLVRRLDHRADALVAHLTRLGTLDGDLGVSGDDLGLAIVEIRGAVQKIRGILDQD